MDVSPARAGSARSGENRALGIAMFSPSIVFIALLLILFGIAVRLRHAAPAPSSPERSDVPAEVPAT